MAALLHAPPFTPSARPVAPSRHHRPARPRLVLVHGGRTTPVPLALPVVLLAVAVALVAVVVTLRIAQGPPPAVTWRELASTSVADASPVPAAGDRVITVQPGDTLWGIAQRLAPGQDPRPVVSALTRANGGTLLQVGQPLVIPGDLVAG